MIDADRFHDCSALQVVGGWVLVAGCCLDVRKCLTHQPFLTMSPTHGRGPLSFLTRSVDAYGTNMWLRLVPTSLGSRTGLPLIATFTGGACSPKQS